MSGPEHSVDGRTLRHQRRRPELLVGAVEYVLDHGVADLSLRPMAEALGVTHATLLRHFGSKEALITEVVVRIRQDLFDSLRSTPDGRLTAPPARVMRAVWNQLCEPAARRQFVLLFEIVAMHARHPEVFGSLAPMLIDDFLAPIEGRLRESGVSAGRARDVATAFLAEVRGLQLDLVVSGQQRRVDAAMKRFIETMTATAS